MKFFIILSLVFLLSACEKSKATPQEQVAMKFFAMLKIGEAYDQTCNAPPILNFKDLKNPSVINWIGNMQVISAKIGEFAHEHQPKMSPEEGAKRLAKTGKIISDKTIASIKSSGCNSAKGIEGKKFFELISQSKPWETFNALEKQIQLAK